jgi:UDP-N-acetyl-2-amino-2-deoxyglucuronate dehydrogenase
MRKIKTGIIGCGKVADIHASALQNLEESEFVAVYSRTMARAKVIAEKYHVTAYDSLQDMLNRSGIEAVVVGTPHPAHREPVIEAAKAGVHAIVEKPLAASLQDCDAMINAGKHAHIKLGTISQRRLYAPVQRVKEAIEKSKIGKPVLGTVIMLGWRDRVYYASDAWRGKWREEGGGVLVNQAPHQLDILQWFMGPIAELYGNWANVNHDYIEVEDTAIAVIRFQNGALGNIVVSNSQNPALYGKVHVHGSNGASIGVQTDGGAMFVAGMSSIVEPPVNDLWTVSGETEMLEKWKKDDTDLFKRIDATRYYHQLQIKDFLQSINDDRDPMVTGEEGRKTVEIFTAIYRSQRDKSPVKFPLDPETDNDDFDGRLI